MAFSAAHGGRGAPSSANVDAGPAERDRFEVYRENFSQYLYRAEVEESFRRPFRGQNRAAESGKRRHLEDRRAALHLHANAPSRSIPMMR